ncbi:MAG: VTT domain-containing protein [Legionellales bacterium]|nr:VTT domain-containing protein [Legionellales bacterium]
MLIESIKPVIQWIHSHPHAGILICALIAFLESLAIIGIFIPGSVLMTAMGTLVGSGVLPPVLTLIAAAIAAFIGDSLSFFLGHHYQEKLIRLWPFSRYPKLIHQGHAFFKRHGKKSVFFGRFCGPMRAIIPAMAGMLRMDIKRFLIADFISAFFWAPGYMLPGILLGAASLALPPEIATRLILIIILSIFIIWLFSWIIHHLINKIVMAYRYVCHQAALLFHQHPGAKKMVTLLSPKLHLQRVQIQRLGLIIAFAIAVPSIALSVKHQGIFYHLNQMMYHLIRSTHCPLFTQLAMILSLFGDKKIILPCFVAGFIILVLQKQWRLAWHWLALMMIAAGGIFLCKHAFHILRPQDRIVEATQFSFPSGHATLVVAFFGMLSLLLTRRMDRKWPVLVIFLLLMLGVVWSRLYLGVHWFADVLAGMMIGAISILMVWGSLQRQPLSIKKNTRFCLATLLIFLIIAPIYFIHNRPLWVQESKTSSFSQTLSFNAWWHEHHTVPMIRYNRLGHPAELMNIEWLGKIENIQRFLSKEGFQLAPKPSLTTTLDKIAAKHGTPQLPLFTVLYHSHQPLLVMTLDENNRHLVLRLWPAPFHIDGSQENLYFGTFYFQTLHPGINLLPDTPQIKNPPSQQALTYFLPKLAASLHRQLIANQNISREQLTVNEQNIVAMSDVVLVY